MRKPKAVWRKDRKHVHHYEWPDKEWLEHQYWGLDRGMRQIAKACGATLKTVERWMRKLGVPARTLKEVGEHNSRRFSGAGNPAWKNGSARGYQKRLLQKHQPEMVCEWCGDTEDIEIHHRDHDRANGNIENLAWLCGPCNSIEGHVWRLQQRGHTVEIRIDEKQVNQ